MITLSFSLLHLGIFIIAVIATYIVVRYVIGFLVGLVLGSTIVIRWQLNRKAKAQSLVGKSQRETLYNRFKELGTFIDWLDKQFQNSKQRKQFWNDWSKTPIMRQDYINRFLNQYAPDVKVIKKEEPKPVEEK